MSSRRAAEPAVVEHEAFDPDRGGTLGERARGVSRSWSKYTASHVLSKHRARRRGCAGRRAEVAWNCRVAGVRPASEWTATTSGVRYDSPGSSTTSPGCSSSPSWTSAARRAAARRDSVVAAPRQVGAPDLAVPLAESGRAGEQQRRVSRATCGRAGSRRANAPVGHARRTRMELAAQRPWNVSSSAACSGSGERDRQPVEQVAVVAVVRRASTATISASPSSNDVGDEARARRPRRRHSTTSRRRRRRRRLGR